MRGIGTRKTLAQEIANTPERFLPVCIQVSIFKRNTIDDKVQVRVLRIQVESIYSLMIRKELTDLKAKRKHVIHAEPKRFCGRKADHEVEEVRCVVLFVISTAEHLKFGESGLGRSGIASGHAGPRNIVKYSVKRCRGVVFVANQDKIWHSSFISF